MPGYGFELRNHQPNDPTGFSATVFFERTTGKHFLAIRGTDNPADGFADAQIGVVGYAASQVVSLYRYYKRLITPADQPVSYTREEMGRLYALKKGIPLLDTVFGAGHVPRSFADELAGDRGFRGEAGGSGPVLGPQEALVVTGHSLGGHLAMMFGRLFPAVTEQVYTFNAPGIGAQSRWLFSRLGVGPLDAGSAAHLVSASGIDLVTALGSTPGTIARIFTEAGDLLHNHAIVPLADSLALHDVFGRLSPSLAGDSAIVSRMIAAVTEVTPESLEKSLDLLRKEIASESSATAIATSRFDAAQRDDYYGNLYRLLDGFADGRDWGIVPLVGKSADELRALGASSVAVRHALKQGSPFAVEAVNYAQEADKLALESAGGVEAELSRRWLAARAEYLSALLASREKRLGYGQSASNESVLYEDLGEGARLSLLSAADALGASSQAGFGGTQSLQAYLAGIGYARKFVFGSDASDTVSGGDAPESIFGGQGDDTVIGAGGGDYLEGGPGNDVLDGGAGNDTLAGGRGADALRGGAGFDTYSWIGLVDADTLSDADGSGLLKVGTDILVGGARSGTGAYRSSDGRYSYAFSGDLRAGGTLTVNGTLVIEGFHNGDLGIRLTDGADVQRSVMPDGAFLLSGDAVLLNDLPPAEEPPLTEWGSGWFDAFGNPQLSAVAELARADWEFRGSPGATVILTFAGDDTVVERYSGDDWIELGAGNDYGFGGEGNDTVFAGVATELDSDLDPASLPKNASGSDWLIGGAGDDILYGNADANVLSGSEGSDLIFGGAGEDLIADNPSSGLQIGPGPAPEWRLVDSPAGGRERLVLNAQGQAIGSSNVTPSADPDTIDAGEGNDYVGAGRGDDLVFGGTGDDFIRANFGSDTVYGEEGDDWIFGDWTGRDRFETVAPPPGVHDDYLDGGPGNDELRGDFGSDVLVGGEGDDQLYGGRGDDDLFGGSGNDLLSGGSGDDLLEGGEGDDTIDGGAGNDRLIWGRGEGIDQVAKFPAAGGKHLTVVMQGGVAPQDVAVSILATGGWSLGIADSGDALVFAQGGTVPQGSSRPGATLAHALTSSTPVSVEFGDGTVWDAAELVRQATGVAPREPQLEEMPALVFSLGGDRYMGGGAEPNRYSWSLGNGADVIEDYDPGSKNVDTLEFGEGVSPDSLSVYTQGGDYLLAAGTGGVVVAGGRTREGRIEKIEFHDGSAWDAAQIEARAIAAPENHAPSMPASLGEIRVRPDEPFALAIPEGAGDDPDPLDHQHWAALTADGDELPAWLQFDAQAHSLSGIAASADAGRHEVLVLVADDHGAFGVSRAEIFVQGAAPAPEPPPVEIPPTAPPAVPVDPPAPPAAEPPRAFPFPIQDMLPPARIGEIRDAVFQGIQSLLSAPALAHSARFMERYAEAVAEFERRRRAREQPQQHAELTPDEAALYNLGMHAWHEAAERALASSEFADSGFDAQPRWFYAFGGGIEGVAGEPASGAEVVGRTLSGVQKQPGLAEGIRRL